MSFSYIECKFWTYVLSSKECLLKTDETEKYHIESTKKSLAEARAFCINRGQKLFEPKSLEAINEVIEIAKAQGVTESVLWIGIWRYQGNFIYDSSNDPIVYENWNPGEPNGESREDCTALGKYSGKWYDVSCTSALPFVCESGKTTVFLFFWFFFN